MFTSCIKISRREPSEFKDAIEVLHSKRKEIEEMDASELKNNFLRRIDWLIQIVQKKRKGDPQAFVEAATFDDSRSQFPVIVALIAIGIDPQEDQLLLIKTINEDVGNILSQYLFSMKESQRKGNNELKG